MDLSALREAGLTEGETKVYCALLELGVSTTGPIVEKSGVARCIIYQILDKLAKKGLVTYIIKEKTKQYQAASPKNLLDYLARRKEEFEESNRKIEDMIPKLLAMQHAARPSEARIYMGFRGMISAHENIYQKLAKGEEYFFLGIPAEQEKQYHAYWKSDHAKRVKAGISCRLLFNANTSLSVLKNRNAYPNCDARLMPTDIDAPAWFMGYKDVAVIGLQSQNPITIEITNQEIASWFKAYFEEFWRRSQKP